VDTPPDVILRQKSQSQTRTSIGWHDAFNALTDVEAENVSSPSAIYAHVVQKGRQRSIPLLTTDVVSAHAIDKPVGPRPMRRAWCFAHAGELRSGCRVLSQQGRVPVLRCVSMPMPRP